MRLTTTKTVQLSIQPSHFNRMNEYIYSIVENQIGTCTKEYGYVVDINNVDRCSQRCISRVSGNCIYDVTYTFVSVKPEVGDVLKVVITNIFAEGIFVKHNSIEMLIPSDTLVGWKYDTSKTFVKDKHKLIVGKWISVNIIAVEYAQHKYICICKLNQL